MPRRARNTPRGLIYHVLNRGVGRWTLFENGNALRQSVQRGSPFGQEDWCARTAEQLGLAWTLRPRGRPHKTPLE